MFSGIRKIQRREWLFTTRSVYLVLEKLSTFIYIFFCINHFSVFSAIGRHKPWSSANTRIYWLSHRCLFADRPRSSDVYESENCNRIFGLREQLKS